MPSRGRTGAARRRQWYMDFVYQNVPTGTGSTVEIGPLCTGTVTPGLELDAMTRPTLVRVRGWLGCMAAGQGGGVTGNNFSFVAHAALWVGTPAAIDIGVVGDRNSDRIIWHGCFAYGAAGTVVLGSGEAYAAMLSGMVDKSEVDTAGMRQLGDDERLFLSVYARGDAGLEDVNIFGALRALYLE